MPLTFEKPEDYDSLRQSDMLYIENVYEGMDNGRLILTDKKTGNRIQLLCSFTERQKAILKAGGLLRYVGQEGGL